MWVIFAIAVLTREVVATSENDNPELPKANIKDETHNAFIKWIGDSAIGPFTANEWKNKQDYLFQDDEDAREMNLITNSGQELKRSVNFYPRPTIYINALLKFLRNHSLEELNRIKLKYADQNRGNGKDKVKHNDSGSGREKRSTKEAKNGRLKRASDPTSTWFDWTAMDNTTPLLERHDSTIPRNAASNPWYGKRLKDLKTRSEIRRPIRIPFNSWGGKRNDESLEHQFFEQKTARLSSRGIKLTPFNSWGGKRASFSGWDGKHVPFNSWGGKRAQYNAWDGQQDDPDGTIFDSWITEDVIPLIETNSIKEDLDPDFVSKRSKFNAWGGKRSNTGNPDDEEVKRTKFNAWGGKRDQMFDSWGTKRVPEEVSGESVFNTWDGKRSDGKVKPDEEFEEKRVPLTKNIEEKKVRFSSWGGKRYTMRLLPQDFNELESNYTNDADNNSVLESRERRARSGHKKTSYFNPWGGKRSDSEIDLLNKDTNLTPESIAIRKIFFPWGG